MTSRPAPAPSSPSWGPSSRFPLGGLALVALWAVLWSLFLGTVGAARPGPVEDERRVALGAKPSR